MSTNLEWQQWNATCKDCAYCGRTCIKGNKFHNKYKSYGIVKSSPVVEEPNAQFCSWLYLVETH
jgi:hypothetical protein